MDSISRFKLRASRLLDAGPGLLGLVAGFRSIWVEGGSLCLGVVVPRTSFMSEKDSIREFGTWSYTTEALEAAMTAMRLFVHTDAYS